LAAARTIGTVQRWNVEDIAWVAGVFEGEGTIRPRRTATHYGAQVSIRMDDEDVIRRIHTILGFGNVYQLAEHRKSGKTVMQYNWQVAAAQDVRQFLTLVMPYLGQRRHLAAEEALANCELVGSNYAHPWTPERRARYAATMARKRAEKTAAAETEATGD
jgi:hypothetical protein